MKSIMNTPTEDRVEAFRQKFRALVHEPRRSEA